MALYLIDNCRAARPHHWHIIAIRLPRASAHVSRRLQIAAYNKTWVRSSGRIPLLHRDDGHQALTEVNHRKRTPELRDNLVWRLSVSLMKLDLAAVRGYSGYGSYEAPMFGNKKPKVVSCFLCSQPIEEHGEISHYKKEHLIPVTDNNDQRAYTFECPQCGLMDRAWGGGSPDTSAQSNAAMMINHHVKNHHGIR
jgi:hypothetical protein